MPLSIAKQSDATTSTVCRQNAGAPYGSPQRLQKPAEKLQGEIRILN